MSIMAPSADGWTSPPMMLWNVFFSDMSGLFLTHGCAYLTYPIGTTVGVSGSFSLVYCDRMPSM